MNRKQSTRPTMMNVSQAPNPFANGKGSNFFQNDDALPQKESNFNPLH